MSSNKIPAGTYNTDEIMTIEEFASATNNPKPLVSAAAKSYNLVPVGTVQTGSPGKPPRLFNREALKLAVESAIAAREAAKAAKAAAQAAAEEAQQVADAADGPQTASA